MPTVVELPEWVESELVRDTTIIKRQVDIYESDNLTPWMLDVPFIDGNVSVDAGRDVRRNFDLSIFTGDGDFVIGPGDDSLWYDKVVRIYRGLEDHATGVSWLSPVGTFLIDRIVAQYHPNTVSLNGRDFTKKLLTDNFDVATLFPSGTALEDVIEAIAINGGITAFDFQTDGETLGKDFLWEANTTRWQAINDVCVAYGYEAFFDATGILVIRPYQDPATSPVTYSCTMEGGVGNVVSYTKTLSDSRLYNRIVVTGQTTANSALPVVAVAENHNPASPTSIENLGQRRTYRLTSGFITTQNQAQLVADRFLGIHSLEEFSIDLETFVVPWLEAGDIIEFLDPKPTVNQPTRFFLHDFQIPLTLDTMSLKGNRVEIQG